MMIFFMVVSVWFVCCIGYSNGRILVYAARYRHGV